MISTECKEPLHEIKDVPWDPKHFLFFVKKMYQTTDESWSVFESIPDLSKRLDFALQLDCEIWLNSLYGVPLVHRFQILATSLFSFFHTVFNIAPLQESSPEFVWENSDERSQLREFVVLAEKKYAPSFLFLLRLVYTLLGVQRGIDASFDCDIHSDLKRQDLFRKMVYDELPESVQIAFSAHAHQPPPLELFRNTYNSDGTNPCIRVEKKDRKTGQYHAVMISANTIEDEDLKTNKIAWYPTYAFLQGKRDSLQCKMKRAIRSKSISHF